MKTRHKYSKKIPRKKTRRHIGGGENIPVATAVPIEDKGTFAVPEKGKTIAVPLNDSTDSPLVMKQYKEMLYHFVNSLDENGNTQEVDESITQKYWEIYHQIDNSSSNPRTKSKLSKLIDFLRSNYSTYVPFKGGKKQVSTQLLTKCIDIFTRLNTDPTVDPGLSEIKNFVFPEAKEKTGVSEIPTTIRKTTEIITDFYPNIKVIDPITGKSTNPNYGRKVMRKKVNVEDDEYMFDVVTSVEEWFRIWNEYANGRQGYDKDPKQEIYTIHENIDAKIMGPRRATSSSSEESDDSPAKEVETIDDSTKENFFMEFGKNLIAPFSRSSSDEKKIEALSSSNKPELQKQTELLNILQGMLTKIDGNGSKAEEERNKINETVRELETNISRLSGISKSLGNQRRSI